tara:strand:+ start:135 stop:980 length:846 start_codon:yes stop_codon:yes gene_type:complete
MNIVGLGNAGCKIAAMFGEYEQYNIYYVGIGKRGKNCISLPKINSFEDADRHNLKINLSKINTDETFFIVAGASKTSGFSLQILEKLKTKHVNLVYIKPKESLLNEMEKKIEKMTFGVFQEYARSGLFKRMYIIDNERVEKVVGKVSLLEYYDSINSVISSTIHMINYLTRSEKVMDNLLEPHRVSKICTLGILDIEAGAEKTFYDLKNIKEKQIFYLLTNEDLSREENVLTQITENIKNMKTDCDSISFSITQSVYEKSLAYVASYTNLVQGYDFLLTKQ